MKTFLRITVIALLLPALSHAKTKPQSTANIPAITLEGLQIIGTLTGNQATFTLTGTAKVEASKGGSLELLAGTVAVTEVGKHEHWKIRPEQNRFMLEFDRSGKFPIQLKFNAAVRESDGWKKVEFRVAESTLQPIVLKGLDADTRLEIAGAALPERKGNDFLSYLPADGSVKLSWKPGRTETEGKLFFSAEMLSQISVSPGLMRQVDLLNFKVMQGELSRIALSLHGSGEVTRVLGDKVLAWNVEPIGNSTERRLVVQLNQPQKDQFALQVQLQTPLGAFPQAVDAPRLTPEGATRFAGHTRIVNEGAVRLEVTRAAGLSQISPDQFPEDDATRAALKITGSQRFVYRFSSADFALQIQADQVLPEINVSEVLAYRVGENEQTIDAEIELEVREAPLRELTLSIPRGYVIAKLSAAGLNDYFQHDDDKAAESELRLVYGQPVSGRHVIQLRLERNQALTEAIWNLARVDVTRAKSVRGHIGIAADPGFRLTPERTQGLTEIAAAFFPRKVTGLQVAFRLSDAAWQASARVERLPQTVLADVFHLFSIGEGIAYGSSLINYVVSGSPVSTLVVQLSDEYYNVEFTGKDIRNWQKTEHGYNVQLHSPVSGPYALLATYERPFKPQGETLTFTGARPVDAQTEQGHTLVISAYQFRVTPVDLSPGLLPLEPGEVPAEYRLFFDAPVLAAYRYVARPFNLKLALNPLQQGESLSQVVDRAALTTHVSKEGQVLTEARYFLKSRGNPNVRIALADDAQLWSATINGLAVVPVRDGKTNLIPLPQRGDPNAVLTLDLKVATLSKNAKRIRVSTPVIDAPVMLAEWKLEPEAKQRLSYQGGTLTPSGGMTDASGFAALVRLFSGGNSTSATNTLLLGILLLAAAFVLWRWAARGGRKQLPGTLVGIGVFAVAIFTLLHLVGLATQETIELPRALNFIAPIQQANNAATLEILNTPETAPVFLVLFHLWPVALGVAVWLFAWVTEKAATRRFAIVFGWLLIFWAALRSDNGAPAFLGLFLVFILVHSVIPLLRHLVSLSRGSKPSPNVIPGVGPAPAIGAWVLLAGLSLMVSGMPVRSADRPEKSATTLLQSVRPESVIQEIRIQEKFALASARIRWQAEKGDVLPLLLGPAVLTQIRYPSNSLHLSQAKTPAHTSSEQQLIAQKSGLFEIELNYQVQTEKRESETGFTSPLPFGVINRLTLTVSNSTVDVMSPQAVSVLREMVGSNTVARVVLSPASNAWIGWRPRSRDTRHEKAVFYSELSHLYVPAAGVIEGVHQVVIRPAQGEVEQLVFDVPAGSTITDVTNAIVSMWRFDPESRKLRVTLSPAQSRPFTLVVRSQMLSGSLPFDKEVGLLSVEGAAGQIGLLGVATGSDVQLDSVRADGFAPINLEDFPAEITSVLQPTVPGLTLRRAFRYSNPGIVAALKVSAVEPDIRVEIQNTLSLGEDRTLLATDANVTITRAGIFKLSFILPKGFDVESISGKALSHWTELKTDTGRLITLNLSGKTEGQQQFAISLAGPGVKGARAWATPKLAVREATKQIGTLLVVPEQGMRLQAAVRNGVTQLDPQKVGIRQKGVLAFRLMQTPWDLALDIEQVDPWVQVTSLQHSTINEAQVKVLANLQYQIENTGLKALQVFLPTNADAIKFKGEQLGDYRMLPGSVTNGLQEWEVKLQRKVIGAYMLQVTFQTPLPEQAHTTILQGIRAGNVNLQRGFVTVRSSGRLQLAIESVPETLQPTEWQSIPRPLQQDLQSAPANFAFRLVEPAYQLPLKLERHEAVKLLPARVEAITFNSVISDNGVMLTRARLDIIPGDKRLLKVGLQKNSRFWFAFVNQNGVWPWREEDHLLIPLDPPTQCEHSIPVEIFYSSNIGSTDSHSLDLELLSPKFDLPLENIIWRVSLSDKWKVKKPTGALQLEQDEVTGQAVAVDVQTYLENESVFLKERTKQAEGFLASANSALEQGDPQQARRAFQAAFGLSGHDAAFNEDARVQLHNIKLQEALVGLNVRQATTTGAGAASLGSRFRDLHEGKDINYTQQDAKDLIEKSTADDNSTFMRLAERIIQQQDAATTAPAAIHATVPEQAHVLTFKRSVAIDQWSSLNINLKAKAIRAVSWTIRSAILLGLVAATVLLIVVTDKFRLKSTPNFE
jgi:hypothetical protein